MCTILPRAHGAPIADGTLNLLPTASSGTRASVPITDGQYAVPPSKGLEQGRYRVEIYAFGPIGGTPVTGDEEDADAASMTRQIIPPRFNQESTLEVDVGAAQVEKDFDLTAQ